MPSWSIHLKIAKELNNKYNLEPNSFLFGSVLPDTNEDWGYKRFDSHYYGTKVFPECPGENMIDIDKFLDEYKDHLDNPLVIGYYVHLLTDNYFNEYVYYNKWVQNNYEIIGARTLDGKIIPEKDDFRIKSSLKHGDFELYGKYLYDNHEVEVPSDSNEIIKNIGCLKNHFLSTEEVEKRVNFLNTEFKGYNPFKEMSDYKLMTKEEIDGVLSGCIEYIDKELDKLINNKGDNYEGRVLK